ncbi:hypothetical protein [Pseudomonas savastanoi]|uniref:hypothetical protein n=1 Tax=Pseudomonas savastanoi TaxID=29438 RepID=UPI00218000FC|nr:hypothetical protein [Pseudomonas savastanoi]
MKKSVQKNSEGIVVQIFTVSDFERVALKYSTLFYSRSLKDGPKNIAYWISVLFFVLTMFFMFCSLVDLALGRDVSTALAMVAVVFEFVGLVVWIAFYEPEYRRDKLKKAGLNISDVLCKKRDREIVKSIWLKKNLSVSPDKYFELIKNLYEVQGMLSESRKNRQLGDRFFSSFFSLKPFQTLLSIPVVLAMINFALKIPGVEFTVANMDLSAFMMAAAKYSLTLFLILITLILIVGLLLMMSIGVFELVSEIYRGKCSDLTKRRFVRALLERADLVG